MGYESKPTLDIRPKLEIKGSCLKQVMCPYEILLMDTKRVVKLQVLLCDLEKWASTKGVEVEREEKVWMRKRLD